MTDARNAQLAPLYADLEKSVNSVQLEDAYEQAKTFLLAEDDDDKETLVIDLSSTDNESTEPPRETTVYVVWKPPARSRMHGGSVFYGVFTKAVETFKHLRQIGLEKARMREGVDPKQIDAVTEMVIEIEATLKTTLTRKPAWFSFDLFLADDPFLMELYEALREKERFFRSGVRQSSPARRSNA